MPHPTPEREARIFAARMSSTSFSSTTSRARKPTACTRPRPMYSASRTARVRRIRSRRRLPSRRGAPFDREPFGFASMSWLRRAARFPGESETDVFPGHARHSPRPDQAPRRGGLFRRSCRSRFRLPLSRRARDRAGQPGPRVRRARRDRRRHRAHGQHRCDGPDGPPGPFGPIGVTGPTGPVAMESDPGARWDRADPRPNGCDRTDRTDRTCRPDGADRSSGVSAGPSVPRARRTARDRTHRHRGHGRLLWRETRIATLAGLRRRSRE